MSRWTIDCHRRHRRLPQFSTGMLTRLAFGMVMIVSKDVRTNVVRRLISITSPSDVPITTQSPTLKGRSSRTVMAPKKLEMLSFAASAKANPEIPSPARSDVNSNPSASAMKIAPTKMMMNRRTLSRAEMSVFSVPSSSSSLSRNRTTS